MSCKNSKHHHRITAAFTRICVPEMRGNVHPDPGGKKNLLVSSQICVHASLRCLTVSTQSHKTWPFKSWIGLNRASSWKMWALMSTLMRNRCSREISHEREAKRSQWAVAGTRQESNVGLFLLLWRENSWPASEPNARQPLSDQHVDARRSLMYRFPPN